MPTVPLTDAFLLKVLAHKSAHYNSDKLARNDIQEWFPERYHDCPPPRATWQGWVRMARDRGLHLSGGIRDAVSAAGVHHGEARHGWRKTKNEDGTSDSVFWKKPEEDHANLVESLKEALHGIEAARPSPAPMHSEDDLLTLYPLADMHIGMQAWGRETGEDYDLRIAKQRVVNWVGQCVASSPASNTAIILDSGDGLHADDQTNQTPRSRHQLDVDNRFFKTVEVAISAMTAAIDLALQKHARVIVKILPGNHNPASYLSVLFAIAERYRDEPRADVIKEPGEFFVMEWGQVMLASHHGDKAKPERLMGFMADAYCEIWGRTRHRFLWTGHLHHLRAADIGGVQWEQLRPVTSRDAHAVSHAYTARAQLQAITYDKTKGEVARVKVNA